MPPLPAEGFRLSPLQRRHWETRNLPPEQYALFCYRLTGPLDRARLRAALLRLLRDHEILRTSFALPDGAAVPLQVIAEERPLDLIEVDEVDLASPGRQEPGSARRELEQRLIAATRSLAGGESLPLGLVQVGAQEHQLLIALPALCADLATASILLRGLAAAYAGSPAPQGEAALQYADIADWLNELESEAQAQTAEQPSFWRELSVNTIGAQRLGIERATAGPAQPCEQRWRVDPELTARLAAARGALGGTEEVLLLACWQALLYRQALRDELIVGVAYSARQFAELTQAPGPLTAYLPHAVRPSPELTFRALLAQTGQRHRDLADHQRSFSWARLDPTPGLVGCPFLFDYHELGAAQTAGGIEFAIAAQQADLEPCRLRLSAQRDGDALTLRLWSAGTTLDAAGLALLADQLQTLLAAVAAQPDIQLAVLPLVGARSQALLSTWEDGPATALPPSCVHELFAAQAARTPDAPAVTVAATGQKLSYGALERRANQLAHALRDSGIGPECLVAVCLPRSTELLVALLGVLKAGAAYIPIDPAQPQARIDWLLRDARPAVVLTARSLLLTRFAHFSAQPELPPVRCVDNTWHELASQPETCPASGVALHHLAYCIYTSGSTGTPKGTLIEHRGLTNYLWWARAAYPVTPGSRVPVNTAIGFDATITSLWCPLIAGGEVVLLPEADEIAALARMLQEDADISLVKLTPSHLQALAPLVARPVTARCLVIGGEALLQRHLTWLRTWAPATRLINEYGPTETVVGCCVFAVSPTSDGDGDGVPIGRPIANTRLAVLDSAQRPVPIGAEGELYISGAGVGRGYLHRPELTAACFLDDPATGGRRYRSGDRVRWSSSGALEFLGRADSQIKLRGHRIELAEIEAALREHPSVRDAVLLLQEEADGHRRLRGFVTLAAPGVTAEQLRVHLAERLPEPMVPATLLILESLPQTRNGKIDRNRLAEYKTTAASRPYAPPQTPAEELLVTIWQDVLKRPRIGIHDRFFELGGDSLLSIQAVARASAAGLQLTLQQMLKLQTIAALALAVAPPSPPRPTVPPLGLLPPVDRAALPADVEDAYPLAAVQLAMLFYSQYHAGSAVYHNISRFRLRAPFSAGAWEGALQDAIARHPILRTSFHLQGFSVPLQLVHRAVALPLQISDLRPLATGEQAAAYARFLDDERDARFVWEEPGLLRLHLHRFSEDECELTLTLHHALLDGWSHATLVTELLTDYEGRLRGQLPARPTLAPAVSFRDFIAAEQAALYSEAARSYWQRALAEVEPHSLPRWPAAFRDAAAAQAAHAALVNIAVPSEVFAGLQSLARLAAAPLKSVVLAAHARVLSFLCNQPLVVTGLSTHGRLEELGAEQVLGNYLNVLPIAVPVEGGTWIELVKQTLEVEQAAMPFRRYPLASIQRERGGRPLFETALNFTHFHVADGVAQLPSLQVLAVEDLAVGEMTLQVNASLSGPRGGLDLQLTYNPDELCPEQAALIAGYYQRILTAMAQAPEGRYETFSPLSDAERQRMLVEWNHHPLEYPAEVLIHHLIERQAAQRPDELALVSYQEQTPIRDRAGAAPLNTTDAPAALTYGALDRRANQLAHGLRALGLGPGSLVAICLDRCVELGVAVLGVLKAGAAYVPLDPTYPEDRLAYMLDNAEARAVVTSAAMLQRLAVLGDAAGGARAVVLLDPGAPVWQQPETPVPRRETPANLAYCIYTSGSTGRPKGVMVTHANWLNSFRMWEQAYRLGECSCHLQMASFSFDVFPADFVRSLATGARLVLCPREWLLDGEKLLALMRAEQVDCAEFIPAVLRHFAQYLQDSGQKAEFLKWVVTGGDVWYLDEYWRWRAVLGEDSRLLNTYGMTEVTVDSSYFETADRQRFSGSTITPIGRPFGNVRHYLLDRFQQPVPIGTCGEIYIGGRGVSLGYINRPELTAERFLDNPFQRGERLCRSGDLGRLLPDGTGEFVGRQDTQVKLRGFRVEIGEIESILSQHPQVRQTAIVVVTDRPGSARLVAYVAWRPRPEDAAAGEPVASEQLRQYLAGRLPDYMVPATIMVLESLPLTPNGKIDRRGLPAPEPLDGSARAAGVPPSTPTETALVAVWQQLLGVAQVGVSDHFADLGGHSLVAMQMAARVRARFNLELSLRAILEHPTIAGLAEYIDGCLLAQQLTVERPNAGEELVELTF